MGSTKFKLRCLVAVHALLAVVPSAMGLLPADIRFLPLVWAVFSVSFGQMMLLGFWVGLGRGRAIWRLSAALLACVYLAVWQSFSAWGSSQFGAAVVADCLVVLAFAIAFFVVRRWFSELRLVVDADEPPPTGLLQYSILNVLVLTGVVALLFGLMRVARSPAETGWATTAATLLFFLVFLIDALCAMWAALSAGRIGWRVFLVFLVAALLGLLQSINLGHNTVVWWLVPGWAAVSVVPIAVVVASLMVVRGCGYRLVPRV